MIKNYFDELQKYIDKLKSESFDGWTEDEIKGYLTACESIKMKIENIRNSDKDEQPDNIKKEY
jgi:hypothetical protein